MTHLRLTWSFDEALSPADATRRPGSGFLRLAPPPVAALQRWARVPLAALILLYLTLSGFTCARWCELIALSAASSTPAHAHHGHVDGDSVPDGAPVAAPAVESEAGAFAYGTCLVQPPNPVGWMVPVFREPPVAATTFAVVFVLVAAALPRRACRRLVTFSLPPPVRPPRLAR